MELPSTLTSMGQSAFLLCTNLESVYSHMETPPTLNRNNLGYYSNYTSNFTNSRLVLLTGTVEDYAAKDGSTLAAGKAYLALPKVHKKRGRVCFLTRPLR